MRASFEERRKAMIRCLLIVFLVSGLSTAQDAAKALPDVADAKYGPHERNVLDFWKAKSETPAPLVLYIHGGGFRAGDKRSLPAARLKEYLDAGFAVAALNYRFTNVAPAP